MLAFKCVSKGSFLRNHFVFLFFGSSTSFAQSSSTLMGANVAGMGYASSTIAYSWALYNNVAGLASITQLSTSYAYEARPKLIGANRMTAAVSLPFKAAAVGIGIFRFGDEVYSENQISLGSASKIGNTSLGVKFNYTQYRAENFSSTSALSLDFGGITRITNQISVGAYINNLTQSKQRDTDGQRVPTKLAVGFGFKPSDNVFVCSEIEKDVDYEATWKSGIEYAIYKKVFFRTGFNFNPSAAFFGLGAEKKNLKFDYAITLNRLVGEAHQVSAVYSIPTRK